MATGGNTKAVSLSLLLSTVTWVGENFSALQTLVKSTDPSGWPGQQHMQGLVIYCKMSQDGAADMVA